MNSGKSFDDLTLHMDALHQHFLETLLDQGGLLAELRDMAIAVERMPDATTLEFLLAAGHPMIWFRATPASAALLGSLGGQTYRIDIAVPLAELEAVQAHLW